MRSIAAWVAGFVGTLGICAGLVVVSAGASTDQPSGSLTSLQQKLRSLQIEQQALDQQLVHRASAATTSTLPSTHATSPVSSGATSASDIVGSTDGSTQVPASRGEVPPTTIPTTTIPLPPPPVTTTSPSRWVDQDHGSGGGGDRD